MALRLVEQADATPDATSSTSLSASFSAVFQDCLASAPEPADNSRCSPPTDEAKGNTGDNAASLSAEVRRLRRRNAELQSQLDDRMGSSTEPDADSYATALSHDDGEETEASSSLKEEHRVFVRALLELLTQRDQRAEGTGARDGGTIKVGSLRKASRKIKGRWKTKHVELRHGTFSYFDGGAKRRAGSRKDIPLGALRTCRTVKRRGAVFELRIKGGSRRLWMAPTREERTSWIQAINSAVPGASVTSTTEDVFSEDRREQEWAGERKKKKSNTSLNSPHRRHLEQYMAVRAASHRAEAKDEYLAALSSLHGDKIKVPVSWIKLQLDKAVANATFLETEISSSLRQLWKDLLRDSVEINGHVITGDSCHGPDRMLGRLTQQILSADAASRGKCTAVEERCRITEAEAVSHARDVLLASNRTNSSGSSYYCAENLCLNRNLAVLCPSSADASPLSITVSACSQNDSNTKDLDVADVSGWVPVRRRSDETWERQYLMLSQSVLSCYAEKPHNLLERIILRGAKVSYFSGNTNKDEARQESVIKEGIKDDITDKARADENGSSAPSPSMSDQEYIVRIAARDGQLVREYLFQDEFDFLMWHASLKKSACSFPGDLCVCEETKPSVDISVNVCTEYKVCTLDPSGIESEDTWALLQATFLQKMSLTAGGRISWGDEVVEIDILSVVQAFPGPNPGPKYYTSHSNISEGSGAPVLNSPSSF